MNADCADFYIKFYPGDPRNPRLIFFMKVLFVAFLMLLAGAVAVFSQTAPRAVSRQGAVE